MQYHDLATVFYGAHSHDGTVAISTIELRNGLLNRIEDGDGYTENRHRQDCSACVEEASASKNDSYYCFSRLIAWPLAKAG